MQKRPSAPSCSALRALRLEAALGLGVGLALAACTVPVPPGARAPIEAAISATRQSLLDLPPPAAPIPVAVYGFSDQTGQYKPSETVQSFSRAVSQGGTSVLIQALRDAGQRRWFLVLERERLDNLLKERQVISEMRARYLGETKINPEALPPMLFAGVLLEGGVIGYDSNTLTGGLGARYLGIGAFVEYRQDTITVYLRAVATKTGEILSSVVTRKTVASVAADAGVFKFVSFRDLLEAETGVTMNEPGLVALEQAIEKAVLSLVLAGSEAGTWSFADRGAGRDLLDRYAQEQGMPGAGFGGPLPALGGAEGSERAVSIAPGDAEEPADPQARAPGREPAPPEN